jgi:pimeloyl-ACP methyl ester carboxylesterase
MPAVDGAPNSYSLDVFADDAARVCAHFSSASGCERPPILVGASLGGLAALVAHGERAAPLTALAVIDIAPKMEVAGAERITAFMRSTLAGFPDMEAAQQAVSVYNPGRKRGSGAADDGLMNNLRFDADSGRYFWHWDPRFLDWAEFNSSGCVLVWIFLKYFNLVVGIECSFFKKSILSPKQPRSSSAIRARKHRIG